MIHFSDIESAQFLDKSITGGIFFKSQVSGQSSGSGTSPPEKISQLGTEGQSQPKGWSLTLPLIQLFGLQWSDLLPCFLNNLLAYDHLFKPFPRHCRHQSQVHVKLSYCFAMQCYALAKIKITMYFNWRSISVQKIKFTKNSQKSYVPFTLRLEIVESLRLSGNCSKLFLSLDDLATLERGHCR